MHWLKPSPTSHVSERSRTLLGVLGVGGGDFGAKDVEPAAVAASVDGFTVHKGMDGLVAAGGMLLGIVKKDCNVGVNGNRAEIGERVAGDHAGVHGLALLGDEGGFIRNAVGAEENGIVSHSAGGAFGLLVFPCLPKFALDCNKLRSELIGRGGDLLARDCVMGSCFRGWS